MHKVLALAQSLAGGASDVAQILTGADDIPAAVVEARLLLEDLLNERSAESESMDSEESEPVIEPPADIADHPRRSAIWDQMVEQLERVQAEWDGDVADMAAFGVAMFLLHELLAAESI